jgi:UDP-N-acetylmuramate dehydrogenase
MNIQTNIPLKQYTTMRLGGPAQFFTEVHTKEELQLAYKDAQSKGLPVFILGGGSNIVAHDEGYAGMIIHMCIPGFAIVADEEIATTITVGAGENWDETVRKSVEMGLTGISAMSAIPGTVGATPVQNVGAYGQEIADTLISLTAYDTYTDTFVTLSNDDCEFSYRDSIFRGRASGRYIITDVTLKLYKLPAQPPFYDSLQNYLTAHNITEYTTQAIRDAVIAIRSEKLPNPEILANTGSFFKNAIVDEWLVKELQQTYPDLRAFDMGDTMFKVPTGWLIEKVGLKGSLLHGMRIYDKNALVLVNESAEGYADLAAARDEIIRKVHDTFRILIEQEPLELT